MVSRFEKDASLAPIVFKIGRTLSGQVDKERRTFFGEFCRDFDLKVSPATRAIDFFSSQCAAARKAVDTWSLVALSIGNDTLNKDIRKKIGQLIWEAREQGEYKEDLLPSFSFD